MYRSFFQIFYSVPATGICGKGKRSCVRYSSLFAIGICIRSFWNAICNFFSRSCLSSKFISFQIIHDFICFWMFFNVVNASPFFSFGYSLLLVRNQDSSIFLIITLKFRSIDFYKNLESMLSMLYAEINDFLEW